MLPLMHNPSAHMATQGSADSSSGAIPTAASHCQPNASPAATIAAATNPIPERVRSRPCNSRAALCHVATASRTVPLRTAPLTRSPASRSGNVCSAPPDAVSGAARVSDDCTIGSFTKMGASMLKSPIVGMSSTGSEQSYATSSGTRPCLHIFTHRAAPQRADIKPGGIHVCLWLERLRSVTSWLAAARQAPVPSTADPSQLLRTAPRLLCRHLENVPARRRISRRFGPFAARGTSG